jgi:hypothetical protein
MDWIRFVPHKILDTIIHAYNVPKFLKFPRKDGICPDKSFWFKILFTTQRSVNMKETSDYQRTIWRLTYKDTKFFKFPNVLGIGPESWLFDKSLEETQYQNNSLRTHKVLQTHK